MFCTGIEQLWFYTFLKELFCFLLVEDFYVEMVNYLWLPTKTEISWEFKVSITSWCVTNSAVTEAMKIIRHFKVCLD